MIDEISDVELDRRLRAADPMRPGSLPSQADTEATLRDLLADGLGSATGARGRRVARGPRGVRGPRACARLSRPRLLAGMTAGVVAVGAAIALLLGTTATSPAFAVTRNADGTVTIKLVRVSGIAGANHKLATMGVRARIVAAMLESRSLAAMQPCRGQRAGTVRTITFDPASIPRRQVLLLSADRAAHIGYYTAMARLHMSNATYRRHAAGIARVLTYRPNVSTAASMPALRQARALVRRARDLAAIASLTAARSSTRVARNYHSNALARRLVVYCGSVLSWPAGESGPAGENK
jgi:hypothetical protein